MKKGIIILIMLFILTGCSVKNINNITVDEALSIGLNEEIGLANSYNKGFKYYIPKGFKIYENDLNNQILVSNGKKYYLNIDIISYHYKTLLNHNENENSIYYKSFTSSNIPGYLEIIKNNDYFFIEMMYNYAIIEVVVENNEINYAIINMLNILKSIEYNDLVISSEIGGSVLTQKESIYELQKPKVEIVDKNFLDWIEEYDSYQEPESSIKDEDKITEKK